MNCSCRHYAKLTVVPETGTLQVRDKYCGIHRGFAYLENNL